MKPKVGLTLVIKRCHEIVPLILSAFAAVCGAHPAIKIGGITATVQFAGLVSPGLFRFNVVVPPNAANRDQTITATYNGLSTQVGALITVQP
jgi:uncharacterized protein (TIGR03437 family)